MKVGQRVRLPDQTTGQISQVLPTGNVVVTLDDDGHRVGAQPRQLELLPHAAESAAAAAEEAPAEPEASPDAATEPAPGPDDDPATDDDIDDEANPFGD